MCRASKRCAWWSCLSRSATWRAKPRASRWSSDSPAEAVALAPLMRACGARLPSLRWVLPPDRRPCAARGAAPPLRVGVGVGELFHRHEVAPLLRLLEDAGDGFVGDDGPGGLHGRAPWLSR